jgi:hypothetical protein
MPFSPNRIVLILLLTVSAMPQLTWGLDCSGESIELPTQEDINNFQSTYGNGGTCDTIKGSLSIGYDYANPQGDITDLGGLLDIKEISGNLHIWYNPLLTNIDGLSSLTDLGYYLIIYYNSALTNVDGLSSLTSTGNYLNISENPVLTNVNGLSSLHSVGGNLDIRSNRALTNVDGLSSLTSVGSTFSMYGNDSLASCASLSRILDQWDDADPGPGPGKAGIPDIGYAVHVQNNLDGCNSIEEIMAGVNVSKINPGLNDAWFNPNTDGQGFFITVFPDLGYVSLAWFTYDTELPPIDATANLGDPGHRWLTGVGLIDGNQVLMNIEMTSGGLFDTATVIERTDPPGSDGTIILTFDSCNSGTVEYDIPSINRQGIVPIQRVAGDNIALCEVLSIH